MLLINMMPDVIRLYAHNKLQDGPVRVLEPSGEIAQLVRVELGYHHSPMLSYERVEYGHIQGLPPEKDGTQYIVPLLVAVAGMRQRKDLLAPYIEVTDMVGNVVGWRYLQKVV